MRLTWHTPEEGKHNAVLPCSDGHVHIRGVKKDAIADHDDMVREFANTLERVPGTVAEASAHFKDIGMKPVPMGDHTAFGPLGAPVQTSAAAPKEPKAPKAPKEPKAPHAKKVKAAAGGAK